MFYRVSTAVISPALIHDLGFTTAQLSDLAAAFFYAFAASQLPMGVALDRIGARVTMGFFALAAIGGVVLFAVGPTPTHLRYCMDSAAMRFIPKEDLKKEGYREYAYLFK